tara:strand:+ start:23015 stop:23455 length:441 start_codon:yes stop_codon:yes gene_type:complete
MAKTGHILRWGNKTGVAVTGIGTSYATTKVITIVMNSARKADNVTPQPHRGIMESIRFQCTAMTGVATVTWKLCSDLGGDETVIQSSAVTLDVGTTTSTVASGSDTIGIPLQNTNATPLLQDTYYLFLKGNAATFSCDYVEFGWLE